MKKSLAIVLAATLVMITMLGAGVSAADKKETKTIVLSTIAGYYSTALKETATQYTRIHPETKVKIEIINDNTAYKTSFDSKMAAGGKDAPDIVHTNLLGDLGDLIQKGWIQQLNSFVQEKNPYNGNKTVFEGIDPAYHKYSYDRNGFIGNLTFDLVGTGFFYNKDIFSKLKITAPKTWEALFAALAKIKKAGYIGVTMPYENEGWMYGAFGDWAYRKDLAKLLILPGDGRYDAKVHKKNTNIKYSVNSPDFDFNAVIDPEKRALASINNMQNPQGPAEVKTWETLRELHKYVQPGWATMDSSKAYTLWISQKAAVMWHGSWMVGTILADQKKLGKKSFKWGTFLFPEFEKPDPNFPGKPRGILLPGQLMGIAKKKDTEQMNRAKDFLKYMYSKDVAQKIFTRTLNVGEFVQGPSLVVGVKLPGEVNAYLEGFKVFGNMNGIWPTYGSVIEKKNALFAAQLKFYDGKITMKQWLTEKDKFVKEATKKEIKDNKYDMNPKTNP